MSVVQQNKETIQQLFDRSLNRRRFDLLPQYVSDEYIGIRGSKGATAFQEPLQVFLKAVPDVQWTLDEIVGEGNTVIVRWTTRGTHTGPFGQLPPTGRKVTNTGVGFFELQQGKVVASRTLTDRLGFLQELNVLPADVTTLAVPKAGEAGQVQFIDRFLVPAAARKEFMERVTINRAFIRQLPGFVEDAAYERLDEQGNTLFITVAVWANEAALQKAKEAVQAEYKQQGFNPAAMMERLHITMERGVYREPVR